METKKRNRREEYTLRVIREAFLDLLGKQSIERISVGELCDLADINRSTFYRHYADVYALLDEICEECFQKLFHDLAKTYDPMGNLDDGGYELILKACTITEDDKELYQLLLFKQPSARFYQRITEAILQLYDGAHDSHHSRTLETKLHYQYLISGILGIWQSWLQDDCKIPKSVIAEIVKIHVGGVNQVIWDRSGPPVHQ